MTLSDNDLKEESDTHPSTPPQVISTSKKPPKRPSTQPVKKEKKEKKPIIKTKIKPKIKTEGKKPNHTWTSNHKSALLEFILDQYTNGKVTDNGNLKSEGWSEVARQMKERFGIDFDRNQLKNQKGALRKIYIDMTFLLAQLGFGWNPKMQMVTADEGTWRDLLEAHPKKYGVLRNNPIEWYNLAQEVFSGTYATGETTLVPGSVPDRKTENDELPSISVSAISDASFKRRTSMKAKDLTSDEEEDVVVATKEPPKKRVREGKFEIIKQGVESIVHVLRKTAPPPQEKNPPPPPPESTQLKPSVIVEAIQMMASMFLQSTPPLECVKYIKVVESEANTSIFLQLASTTNNDICKAWLEQSYTPASH